jgi:hypothetical protein
LLCKLQTGRRQFLNLFIDKVEAKGERRVDKTGAGVQESGAQEGRPLGAVITAR